MLHKYPETLAKIRKEHEEVLGPIENTSKIITEDPYVLNKLEYTAAVVRETLRLWPAASSTRTGDPGFKIRDPKTGEPLPTEDILVWVVSYAMHHDEDVWGPTVNKFDPDRFMPENQQYLPKNGFRPFEIGPRNCIGQELAMLESRIILALVVRKFDFTPCYDRLEELSNDGSNYAKDTASRRGKQDLDGEVAYPVLIGTAKPREGMPVVVTEL
jgi:cytochrome P450